MMIIMHPGAPREQIQNVIAVIEEQKLSAHLIEGVEQTIIGAVGDGHYVAKEIFEALPGVLEVQRISKPYKLASRQFHEQDSIFPLDGFTIGGIEVPIIAGPCSVESRARGKRGRGECVAGRRIQAAYLTVCISGVRGRGVRVSGGSP
jgi:3-deoxy-7-phosphoheptulonate synthase